MHWRGLRFKLQCPAITRHGVGKPTKVLERGSQVIVRLGKVGFDLQCPLMAVYRIVKVTAVSQGST